MFSVFHKIFTFLESNFVLVPVFYLSDTRLNLQNGSRVPPQPGRLAFAKEVSLCFTTGKLQGSRGKSEERACWSSFRGHVERRTCCPLVAETWSALVPPLGKCQKPSCFRVHWLIKCGLVTRIRSQSPYSQGCDL